MRSLLFAGAVLAAVSTVPAQAWTQSLLHPESRGAAIVAAMPAPPHYTRYGEPGIQAARRVPPPVRATVAPVRPSDPPAWPSCPWC